MYEVKSDKVTVSGRVVKTWSRVVNGINLLEVEAGTTGLRGGDRNKGSRAFLRLTDLGGTDMSVFVLNDRQGKPTTVEIAVGGDSEVLTIFGALRFAVKALEDQLFKEGMRHD